MVRDALGVRGYQLEVPQVSQPPPSSTLSLLSPVCHLAQRGVTLQSECARAVRTTHLQYWPTAPCMADCVERPDLGGELLAKLGELSREGGGHGLSRGMGLSLP